MEEFYVIRVAHVNPEIHKPQEAFVGADDKLLRANRALRFASVEEAEAFLSTHEQNPAYEYTIQFCMVEGREVLDTPLQKMVAQIMEIPPPYRRTAYNWIRGKDVRAILMRESAEVYERHRHTLLEYAIDITRPSEVILFRRPGRHDINELFREQKGDQGETPRQYFAYPDQRPKT